MTVNILIQERIILTAMPLLCPHLGFWQDLHTSVALLFLLSWYHLCSLTKCWELHLAMSPVLVLQKKYICWDSSLWEQMVERRLVQPENFVHPYVKLESCIVNYHIFLSLWKCTKNYPFKVTMNSYCLGHVNKLFSKLTCWHRHE